MSLYTIAIVADPRDPCKLGIFLARKLPLFSPGPNVQSLMIQHKRGSQLAGDRKFYRLQSTMSVLHFLSHRSVLAIQTQQEIMASHRLRMNLAERVEKNGGYSQGIVFVIPARRSRSRRVRREV
jgi:hypothetical protein